MFRKKLKKDIEKKSEYYEDIGLLADMVLSSFITGGTLAKAIITILSRYKQISPTEVSYRYKLAQESLSRHKDELKSVMVKILSEIKSGKSSGYSGGYNYGNSGRSLDSKQTGSGYSGGHEDSIERDLSEAKIPQDGTKSNEQKESKPSSQKSKEPSSSGRSVLLNMNTW